MIIKNRYEGLVLLQSSGLNYFPEKVFTRSDTQRIGVFLQKYHGLYFFIRDMEKSQGLWFLVNEDAIMDKLDHYSGKFSIAVAGFNYGQPCLVGDVYLSLDLNTLLFALSDNPEDTPRSARNEPKWYKNTSYFEFERYIDDIPFFDNIIDYIFLHALFDVYVEFAVYDREVGINHEKVVIFELRTNY